MMRLAQATIVRSRLAVVGLACASTVLGACGSTEQQADTTTTEAVLGEELAGRWAHHDVVAYSDESIKTLIVSLGFTDFAVEDGRLVESEEFCSAYQVSDQPIETEISDAATQAIRPASTPVRVTATNGELRVQRPPTPTPVGIRLEDPANDTLPSDPADPRIVDDDGDGNPGITVTIRFGEGVEEELYLARREIFAYDMTTGGPDTMVGTVTDSSEQLLIGATSPALLSATGQWVQHPDPDKSPIVLRRVDATWDCERLMTERDELFPIEAEIDW